MNMQLMLDYLAELEENNEKDWYHAHKEEYTKANAQFLELVEHLNLEISKFDNSVSLYEPKHLTFKLMRDTRFSKDKSPYNPSFRAHIGPKGKLPIPVGYYLMIRPGGKSFLGGGLFADMFKDATNMIRDYLLSHGQEWEEIIGAPEFTRHFTVDGSKLKNVPRGYDADHPQAEYLKYKSWYLEYTLEDSKITQDAFLSSAIEIFRAMKPFNDFLNQALENFQMPQR